MSVGEVTKRVLVGPDGTVARELAYDENPCFNTALAEQHELLTLFNTFEKLTLEVCNDLCSNK